MYILDTNVVSELRKGSRAEGRVVEWVNALPTGALFISAITVLELEQGILAMERRDPHQGARLREWFENQVLPTFAYRTLAVDATVARCCARLHVPDPRSERDALIAATALVHRMTVVTRNEKDFVQTGVQLFNPWRD